MKKHLQAVSLFLAVAAGASGQTPGTGINLNHLTPAPPTGARNVTFQNDSTRPIVNTSAYVTYPTVQVPCGTSTGDLSAPVATAMAILNPSVGGILDARACLTTTWTTAVYFGESNIKLLLPCLTITATQQMWFTVGVQNDVVEGCANEGGSVASSTAGGTVWVYNGYQAAFLIGSPSTHSNTVGISIKNMLINVAGGSGAVMGVQAYTAQELNLQNLYILGPNDGGSIGIQLDGTGNYTGGRFDNIHIDGFNSAIDLTGHDSGSVVDDYANASLFTKMHIDCAGAYTTGGEQTYGIEIDGGDGNTFTGMDIEGCYYTITLGPAATSNTFNGIRYESTTEGVLAFPGSSFNSLFFGTTIYTGDLNDLGSRNSFFDAFHRTFNGWTGDWYASQSDQTVTDHQRLGTGTGNERGRATETQTDYGYRWVEGLTDGTSGQQFWELQDLINNVDRVQIGQFLAACTHCVTNVVINDGGVYSSSTPPTLSFAAGAGTGAAGTPVMGEIGTSGNYEVLSVTMTAAGSGYTANFAPAFSGSNQTTAPSGVVEVSPAGGTNDQTVINAAGTGAVVLNGSNNSGTGGVVIGSGGATETTVASFDNTGDLSMEGNQFFYDGTTLAWEIEGDNTASFAIRNNAATTPTNIFQAYPNAATEIDSQGSSAVIVNNHATAGSGGFAVYGGGPSYYNTVLFGITQSAGVGIYHFPGIAAATGHNCIQVDNSGYETNTGSACGTGTGDGSMTSYDVTTPTDITATGCLITTSGTCALTWTNGIGPDIAAEAVEATGTPTQCPSNQFSTGVTAAWAANCSGVAYGQVSGTPSALPPNGSASGDLSGSYPGPTVAKIEGGAIPTSVNHAGYNSSGQPVASPNALGCVDGYDHLPCVVYQQSNQAQTAVTGLASLFTTNSSTGAGIYRVTGYIYCTSTSSTAFTAQLFINVEQSGQSSFESWLISSAQVGTSCSTDDSYSQVLNMAASGLIKWETVASGTQTGGGWSTALTVERLQ